MGDKGVIVKFNGGDAGTVVKVKFSANEWDIKKLLNK